MSQQETEPDRRAEEAAVPPAGRAEPGGTPAGTEPAAEAELPTGPGSPTRAEALAQTEWSSEPEPATEAESRTGAESPTEAEAPAETESPPTEGESATGVESPAEPEPPARTELPADAEPPTDAESLTEGASVEQADPAAGAGVPAEPAAAEPATEPAPEPHTEDAQDAEDDTVVPVLGDDELECAIEALLLVVDSPADEDSLATALGVTPLRVAERLRLMADRYTDQDRGIDLRRAGGGWRFYTRDRYAPYVEKLLLDGQRAKLTRAALETLAVIAYRQPVTRARVAAVRGVNCDGVIRTLLARGLVEETGTDVETGGFLYRTTELFLERLGLSSLEDLPPIAPLLPEVDSIDDV